VALQTGRPAAGELLAQRLGTEPEPRRGLSDRYSTSSMSSTVLHRGEATTPRGGCVLRLRLNARRGEGQPWTRAS
jgi:hypothetical protein